MTRHVSGITQHAVFITLALRLCLAYQFHADTATLPKIDSHWNEVINRDVVVVGGGASGTYAAVQLHAKNISVAVIENRGELGGHTETYYPSAQDTPVNIGVEVYHPDNITRAFFAELGVGLEIANLSAGQTTQYIDFTSGQPVLDAEKNSNASNSAIRTYVDIMNRYPYLWSGFDLDYPVAEDLLLPFGDFVKKHHIEALVRSLSLYYQGLGDLLAQPTLYVMKNFDPQSIKESLGGQMLTTASGNNQELYQQAQRYLTPQNVFLHGSVVTTKRSDRSRHLGTQMLISTPTGLKLIRAKKVIVAIPPLLDNMQGWDLDELESALFAQFTYAGYWTGLVNNTGLNTNVSYVNAGKESPYHLPIGPSLYALTPVEHLPGVFTTKFGATEAMRDAQVRTIIENEISSLQRSLHIPVSSPVFLDFKSHTPFEIGVSSVAIKNGFYRNLLSLQGRKNTYYTGGAWNTYDSSYLWQFTESIVSKIMQDLEEI